MLCWLGSKGGGIFDGTNGNLESMAVGGRMWIWKVMRGQSGAWWYMKDGMVNGERQGVLDLLVFHKRKESQ